MSKSQWLAIEWDTKELRALLASGPSTARSIQHALTIPFGNDTSDHSETETSPKTPTSTQVNLALAQIFSLSSKFLTRTLNGSLPAKSDFT